MAAGFRRLLVQIDAAEHALGQIFADELQRQLHAGGDILQRGDVEFQDIHHRDHFISHPQQHAHVVAIDQLLDVGVDVELPFLLRVRRHLFRQGDHFEQSADLARKDQGHIALRFAAGAHHHADILGICRGGLDAQGKGGAIGQIPVCGQADRDNAVVLIHACGGQVRQFAARRSRQRRCGRRRTQGKHCRQQQ